MSYISYSSVPPHQGGGLPPKSLALTPQQISDNGSSNSQADQKPTQLLTPRLPTTQIRFPQMSPSLVTRLPNPATADFSTGFYNLYGPQAAAAAAAAASATNNPFSHIYSQFGIDNPLIHSLSSRLDTKDIPVSWNSLHLPVYSGFDPAFNLIGPNYRGIGIDGARRKNATRETTSTLKAWLNDHRKNPYPTKAEKIMLAIISKMTLTQVSTWFANARRRLKKENQMTWSPRNKPNEDRDSDDVDDIRDGQATKNKDQAENSRSESLGDISHCFSRFKATNDSKDDNKNLASSSDAGSSSSFQQSQTAMANVNEITAGFLEQHQMMLKQFANLPRSLMNNEAFRHYQHQRTPLQRPLLHRPSLVLQSPTASLKQEANHSKPITTTPTETSPSSHLPNGSNFTSAPLKLRTNSVSSSSASASSHDHSPSPPFDRQQRLHQHLHHPYAIANQSGASVQTRNMKSVSSSATDKRLPSTTKNFTLSENEPKVKTEMVSQNDLISSEMKKKTAKIWSPLDLPDRKDSKTVDDKSRDLNCQEEDEIMISEDTERVKNEDCKDHDQAFPRPFVNLQTAGRKNSLKNKDSARNNEMKLNDSLNHLRDLSANGLPTASVSTFPHNIQFLFEEYRRLHAMGTAGQSQMAEPHFRSLANALASMQAQCLMSTSCENDLSNPTSSASSAPVRINNQSVCSPVQCDAESHASSDSESNATHSNSGMPMNLSKSNTSITTGRYSNNNSDVEDISSNGNNPNQLQSIAAT